MKKLSELRNDELVVVSIFDESGEIPIMTKEKYMTTEYYTKKRRIYEIVSTGEVSDDGMHDIYDFGDEIEIDM